MARKRSALPSVPGDAEDTPVLETGASQPVSYGLPGSTVPPSPVGSIGWFVGIASRPETPAEHNVRLGDRAQTFADAGWVAGTLAPRVGWPAAPAVMVPVVDPEPQADS